MMAQTGRFGLRVHTWAVVAIAAALVVAVGCAPAPRTADSDRVLGRSSTTEGLRSRPTTSTSVPFAVPSTTVPVTTTTAPPPPPPPLPPTVPAPATDVASFLAPLVIDDARSAPVPYDRDDWAGWSDPDDDGCDGRQQALIASSISPAQVDRFDCTVIAGDWFSAYDGFVTADPSDLDVDHLVSLSEAHQAGGWQWTAPWRRLFVNDQGNLWVVSASANRSKSDDGPHQWRPPRREVWCDYAVRWVQVKVAWRLTATTPERDALGAMLTDCPVLPPPPTSR